jgi:hypothetical protein
MIQFNENVSLDAANYFSKRKAHWSLRQAPYANVANADISLEAAKISVQIIYSSLVSQKINVDGLT